MLRQRERDNQSEESRPMSLKQSYVLVIVLPNILLPFLIVLAAGIGIARWRRMILVLAIVALALFIFGAVFLRFTINGDQSEWLMYRLQSYATPAINSSGVISAVGVFLALILAARSHKWRWFIVLAVAEAISALAGLVAFSSYGLEIFVGSEQALSLFLSQLFAIFGGILAGLAMVAQLLYALIGSKTATAVTPEVG
jgi:hypothetical protein